MAARAKVFLLGSLAIGVLALALLYPAWHRRYVQGEHDRLLMRGLATPLRTDTDFAEWLRLGTAAVPVLTKALETKPTTIDKVYAPAWSNAPPAVRSKLPPPLDATTADTIRVRASALLSRPEIGKHVPIDTVVKELRNPSWGVRMNAIVRLDRVVLKSSGTEALGEDKGTILALVLAAAQDPKKEVRMMAVYCLQHFKDASDQVTPVLANALTDYYPDVRVRAAIAFYRIDPIGAEKAGALSIVSDVLQYHTPFGAEDLAAYFLSNEVK
jgi:HEAT repeat protein